MIAQFWCDASCPCETQHYKAGSQREIVTSASAALAAGSRSAGHEESGSVQTLPGRLPFLSMMARAAAVTSAPTPAISGVGNRSHDQQLSVGTAMTVGTTAHPLCQLNGAAGIAGHSL